VTGDIERVHTNRIEGAWKHAKAYFRTMNGTSVGNFESHLCEWMFRSRERSNATVATLHLIRRHYPLTGAAETTDVQPVFDTWYGGQGRQHDDTINRADSSCSDSAVSDDTDDGTSNLDVTGGEKRHTYINAVGS
jgi:hypothetical protein